MYRTIILTTTAIGFSVFLLAVPATAATKKCTNIQARCAIEIGGRCDPVTGKWEYGKNGAGGNTRAYDACISRAAGKPK